MIFVYFHQISFRSMEKIHLFVVITLAALIVHSAECVENDSLTSNYEKEDFANQLYESTQFVHNINFLPSQETQIYLERFQETGQQYTVPVEYPFEQKLNNYQESNNEILNLVNPQEPLYKKIEQRQDQIESERNELPFSQPENQYKVPAGQSLEISEDQESLFRYPYPPQKELQNLLILTPKPEKEAEEPQQKQRVNEHQLAAQHQFQQLHEERLHGEIYLPSPVYVPLTEHNVTPTYLPTESTSAEFMPYDFDWEVIDLESNNVFSHKETSDGKIMRGEYRVLLPDGRLQIVRFQDKGNGYEAKVTYETYNDDII